MSINSLPPQLYIALMFVIGTGLCFFTIRGRVQNEPILYTIMGTSFIISVIFATIQKIFHSYLKSFESIAIFFENATIVAGIIGTIIGFVGVFKYGNESRKKITKWTLAYLVLVAISIIFFFNNP